MDTYQSVRVCGPLASHADGFYSWLVDRRFYAPLTAAGHLRLMASHPTQPDPRRLAHAGVRLHEVSALCGRTRRGDVSGPGIVAGLARPSTAEVGDSRLVHLAFHVDRLVPIDAAGLGVCDDPRGPHGGDLAPASSAAR